MLKFPGTWRCSDCAYESKNKNNMYEHIECRHVTHPGYVCPHCSKRIASRNSLRNHIIRMHKFEDPQKMTPFQPIRY